jgi:hypothetical protein
MEILALCLPLGGIEDYTSYGKLKWILSVKEYRISFFGEGWLRSEKSRANPIFGDRTFGKIADIQNWVATNDNENKA